MTLMKYAMMFSLVNLASFAAFADQASTDAKLALLTSDNSRLQAVNISIDDAAIKSEQVINGDESSSSIVYVTVGAQVKTYVITRDGGGTIHSIVLAK